MPLAVLVFGLPLPFAFLVLAFLIARLLARSLGKDVGDDDGILEDLFCGLLERDVGPRPHGDGACEGIPGESVPTIGYASRWSRDLCQ